MEGGSTPPVTAFRAAVAALQACARQPELPSPASVGRSHCENPVAGRANSGRGGARYLKKRCYGAKPPPLTYFIFTVPGFLLIFGPSIFYLEYLLIVNIHAPL